MWVYFHFLSSLFLTLFQKKAHAKSHTRRKAGEEKIKVKYVNKDGSVKEVETNVGLDILEVAHENEIDLEGACEGSCACSTCHVILEEDVYNQLPPPSEEEEDMLDLAFALSPTSRLGCQVVLQPSHNNITITLPKATRNMWVDKGGKGKEDH